MHTLRRQYQLILLLPVIVALLARVLSLITFLESSWATPEVLTDSAVGLALLLLLALAPVRHFALRGHPSSVALACYYLLLGVTATVTGIAALALAYFFLTWWTLPSIG
jgi:hypothetical protein